VAAFATPTELAAFLQRDLNTASAQQAVDLASQAIRQEIAQDVDVATTTETLDGSGGPWLFLEQWPVTAVTSVTEKGVLLVVGADYRFTQRGAIGRWGGLGAFDIYRADPTGRWPVTHQGIVVVYTHGWLTTTKEYGTCKRITLQVAGRAYINPGQHASKEIGQSKETWGVQASPGRYELMETEKRDLDPLRRR